ncbi:hypothetical protein [Flavobacterium sp. UMI-01]|uniref:hypothetical protein n=1 Tax=Flavobacterium sp. UMI-01 TaxID=1441053 RepID=UPI001C7D3358|nr:hypothetical protein [Flavobacterium sp. UMI-01]GIZ09477.1 hypothetical protein FUMI01_22040 [Flavobacterium sp. UMI-01]
MAQYQINFYKRVFDFEPAIVNIDLIGKHKDYLALSHHTNAKYKTAGFYQSTTNKAYVDKTRSSYVKTIYHEMQHALIHQVVPNVPAWINEGMSELFECFEVSKEGVTPSIQGYKFLKMKEYISQNKLNLRAFLGLNHGEWHAVNGTEEGYSYTVSYSFVCFLFMKYPNAVEMILQKIKQGKTSIQAIEYATKKDFTVIEEEFKKQMK